MDTASLAFAMAQIGSTFSLAPFDAQKISMNVKYQRKDRRY